MVGCRWLPSCRIRGHGRRLLDFAKALCAGPYMMDKKHSRTERPKLRQGTVKASKHIRPPPDRFASSQSPYTVLPPAARNSRSRFALKQTGNLSSNVQKKTSTTIAYLLTFRQNITFMPEIDWSGSRVSLAHTTMEVQSLLAQWPDNDISAQRRLIDALQVTNWTRVNTIDSVATMPARLRFRANFGTLFHAVTLCHVAEARDANNLSIRVFAVEHDENTHLPQEVFQHKALVLRQIPQNTLVVQWSFDVDRSCMYVYVYIFF